MYLVIFQSFLETLIQVSVSWKLLNQLIQVIHSGIRLHWLCCMCLIYCKEPTHFFSNQTTLDALHVFDSLRRTDWLELFLQESDHTGCAACVWFIKKNWLTKIIPSGIRPHWIHVCVWFTIKNQHIFGGSDYTGCAIVFNLRNRTTHYFGN